MTEVRVEDGGGSSLRFLDVDSFLYPAFPVDYIRGIRDLEVRPDDVLVCGYPKSGQRFYRPVFSLLLPVFLFRPLTELPLLVQYTRDRLKPSKTELTAR